MDDLRRALERVEIPGEHDARERAWAVVHRAHAEREPVAWPRRHARPLLLAAAAAALAAVIASPPGHAVLGSLRDAIGREKVVERAHPLLALPAPGRLLVDSARGPWVVAADGSKRLLGNYAHASWSPHGLFVVVTTPTTLTAVDPKGAVRWSLERRAPVAGARWSPDGYRVAYTSGGSLRVVAGDGTGDRALADAVAPPLAWRPVGRHELAFGDPQGRIHLVQTDENRPLALSAPGPRPRALVWSADGQRLLALGPRSLRLLDARGRLLRSVRLAATAAAFERRGHAFALTVGARVLRVGAGAPRAIFAGAGRLGELAYSPDGRWLLVAWPSADQWLFLRAGVQKVDAVAAVARAFAPGASGPAPFPKVVGWCCPDSP